MSVTGYNRLQIGLHWLIAALLVVSYASSDGMGRTLRGVLRGTVDAVPVNANVHIWVGLAILGLVVVRLGVRLARGVPELPGETPGWVRRLSQISHWLLYGFLILIPATGALAWYGQLRSVGDIHGALFNIGFALVGLHTAAALFHHYVLKDRLIARMVRPA